MKAWDTAIIKVDSNNADKGRAGVIQAVSDDGTKVTIRLDETPDGKDVKVVVAAAADIDVKHVL